MPSQKITFTEWTPDQPSIVENLSIAKNVVAAAIGYISFPLPVNYSSSASEDLNSLFAGKFNTTTNIFCGGATKLFRLDGSTLALNDVSKSGGYSNIGRWNFTQFGNTVIAANNINKLQSFTLGGSTTFDDLSADAPIAKYVTVVRDFVVAANINAGTDSNMVQWSDINDETDWVSGGASQSDFQIIPDGGNIRGITGGEFGLVLLDRAIVRMTYIGSPYFFQFDTIARGIGCVEGNSVAKYGNVTYFLGEEGFYACDGQSVTPIGNEKIDRWFWANANPSALESMSTTIDPFRKIVVWNFLDNFGKRNLIVYNWQVQKWTYAETDVDFVSSSATAGATLEGMDLYGNMDTIETSFDSPLFSGGKFLFSGVRDNKIVTFTGQPSAAQIDTGLIGSEYPTVVTLARPLVDSGSSLVAIASQVLLNQVVDFGSYTPSDNENRVSLRSAGKYHKLSVKPTGSNWSNIIGIDIEVQPQGTR